MKKVLIITLLTIFPVFVISATFERNLTFGAQGNDVLELQRTLNRDPLTRIAESGPGSPGNETLYFGQMTRNAVIKFQELYAPEVLFPIGLYKGTGFVGSYTLSKLNKIHQPADVSSQDSFDSVFYDIPSGAIPQSTASNNLETNTSNSISSNTSPQIFSLSRYRASRGSEVVVFGNNFDSSENTIYFSGATKTISGIQSEDSRTLSFKVPDGLPYGAYNLSVVNKKGTSFNASFGNYFVVSDSDGDLPKVFSVEPKTLGVSGEQSITIKGENFDKNNNKVLSSFGLLEGVPSSDGKTISIRLKDFSTFSQIEVASRNIKTSISPLSVYFNVQTAVGISSESVFVTLQF